MRTLASGETDAAVIAQAFRTIPAPGAIAGNMVVLNGSALVPPASLPVGAAATIINGVITASVGSSALTLAVKTLAGADPSTDDPVLVIFRSATAALGTFVARQITAALSIVIPSSATLGHVSARDQQIIVYAIDNSGTVELAVATPLFDQSARLKTTTTIGAGSTSAATIYSSTGRSNLPWAPIARCVSNQTTAGTWANGPSASAPGILQIDMAPFTLPTNACRIYLNSIQTGVAGATHTKVAFDTADFDPDSVFVAASSRVQPKVSGTYLVSAAIDIQATNISGLVIISIAKNGSRISLVIGSQSSTSSEVGLSIPDFVQLNGTSDFIEVQTYMTLTAGTGAINNGITITHCALHRTGP